MSERDADPGISETWTTWAGCRGFGGQWSCSRGVSAVLSPCAKHPLRAEPGSGAELSMGAGTAILQTLFQRREGRELYFARARNPLYSMEVSHTKVQE